MPKQRTTYKEKETIIKLKNVIGQEYFMNPSQHKEFRDMNDPISAREAFP